MAGKNEKGRHPCQGATRETSGINSTGGGALGQCDVSTALVRACDGEARTDSLAISCEFGRAHKDVLRALDELISDGTIDQRDFALISYNDSGNRKQRAIELNERAALIAMPFVGGRRARDGQKRLVAAFLAMRERLSAARAQSAEPVQAAPALALPDFSNPALAARAWANQFERAGRAERMLELQAPRVAALEQLIAAPGSMCITDAAKALGVAPRTLFAWLDANAWTYRRGGGRPIPYQAVIMRGMLEYRTRVIEREDGSEKMVQDIRVTSKGLAELARRVAAGDIPVCGGVQ